MNTTEMKTDDDYTTMLDTTECITVGETAALALNALYCLISIDDCEVPRPESHLASLASEMHAFLLFRLLPQENRSVQGVSEGSQ